MNNGIAIIEVNDTETRSIFFDHEVVEFAKLNALTKKRLAQAEANRAEYARNCRKAEKAVARRTAYTVNTFFHALGRFAVAGAAVWAGIAGFIHPFVFLPVALISCCTACGRLGVWFGKVVK